MTRSRDPRRTGVAAGPGIPGRPGIRRGLRIGLGAAILAALARAATAAPPPAVAAELARLEGHRVELSAGGAPYRIVDVAGEGPPEVGIVERRGRDLWLRPFRGPARRLAGPLAVPRIAGPGYKVWVIGRPGPDGSLVARRLGVLAPPPSR